MINNYPYLTEIFNKKKNKIDLGLIQLVSKNYMSYYNIADLSENDLPLFLKMADKWWAFSPFLPISIYYPQSFNKFNYSKIYLTPQEYSYIDGFNGINLKNLAEKRIKRKIIHLD